MGGKMSEGRMDEERAEQKQVEAEALMDAKRDEELLAVYEKGLFQPEDT
jgi:hypothetical protein